jgi:hypothetical protein
MSLNLGWVKMMGDEGSGFFMAMFSAFCLRCYFLAYLWCLSYPCYPSFFSHFAVRSLPLLLSSFLPLDFCCRLVGDWTERDGMMDEVTTSTTGK